MATPCDYETRWRILGRLIQSESRWYEFVLDEDAHGGLRRVMRWMLAIDAGVLDVERLKELKALRDDNK